MNKEEKLLKKIGETHNMISQGIYLSLTFIIILLILIWYLWNSTLPSEIQWILSILPLAVVLFAYSYYSRFNKNTTVIMQSFYRWGKEYKNNHNKSQKIKIFSQLNKSYKQLKDLHIPQDQKNQAYEFIKDIHDKDKKLLDHHHKKIKARTRNIAITTVFLLLAATLALVPFPNNPVGYVVLDKLNFEKPVGETFNQNQELVIDFNYPVSSFSLTGEIIGEGSVLIYQEKNGKKQIILDSTSLTKKTFKEYCASKCLQFPSSKIHLIILVDNAKVRIYSIQTSPLLT